MAVTAPPASSHIARRTMQANRRVNTGPERRVRSELHHMGLRFRKDMRLDLEGGRVRPDIVFTRAKVAVFVDGCYWHSCPQHGARPKANAEFWSAKLTRNVARDRRADDVLAAAGWTVLRVWEHEEPTQAARRIHRTLTGDEGMRGVRDHAGGTAPDGTLAR